ncbi:hypothetical protein QN277_004952 [Acacia crassicarpa]|uniref:Endonuclease/exonuclease/phosphatase domain-containing protein n=1 Tax=Acacia crassicarpa TaxID=499986 RepID=A0AAE1IVP9_9FABA|nr:hypothetical protein QN277_004952 [Acacia crassicarpa]
MLILAETKATNDAVFQPLRSWGFDSCCVVPSEGRSGGLGVFWRTSEIGASVLAIERQLIHLECLIPGIPAFNLTAVYGIPHSNLREQLWNSLLNFSASITRPWVVYGDFNDILSSQERIGGVRCNHRRINWFNNQVRGCGLSDLGSLGPRFTWRGPLLRGCDRLYERLDRALGNNLFLAQVENYVVKE